MLWGAEKSNHNFTKRNNDIFVSIKMERKNAGLYTSKNGKTFANLQITLATNEITSLI